MSIDSELVLLKAYNVNNGQVFSTELELTENDNGIISMGIICNNKHYSSNGEYYFPVFQKLKDDLLQDNIGLQCYGSMINAHASAMMGGVPKVYLLKIGQQAKKDDIVFFLDYVNINVFSTTEEQNNFYEIWDNSWLK